MISEAKRVWVSCCTMSSTSWRIVSTLATFLLMFFEATRIPGSQRGQVLGKIVSRYTMALGALWNRLGIENNLDAGGVIDLASAATAASACYRCHS